MSEWSNEQTWKVCIRDDCIEGSNPSLSAKSFNLKDWSFFYVQRLLIWSLRDENPRVRSGGGLGLSAGLWG